MLALPVARVPLEKKTIPPRRVFLWLRQTTELLLVAAAAPHRHSRMCAGYAGPLPAVLRFLLGFEKSFSVNILLFSSSAAEASHTHEKKSLITDRLIISRLET